MKKTRVAFIIYRSWAYEIFKKVLLYQNNTKYFSVNVLITTKEAEFHHEKLEKVDYFVVDGNDNNSIDIILSKEKIDVVFYYGWSWFVKEPLLSKYVCLCLHPSLLPKYRGGSPIQNQIIDGKKISGVSVFRMGEGVDDGDIYKQIKMPLDGSLNDILKRIITIGSKITKKFILDYYLNKVTFFSQKKLNENPPKKRRNKNQSEIKIQDLSKYSYISLFNFVRALNDPYPNAFICFGGNKIMIQKIKKINKIPKGSLLINNDCEIPHSVEDGIYIKLKDCFVLVEKFKLEK